MRCTKEVKEKVAKEQQRAVKNATEQDVHSQLYKAAQKRLRNWCIGIIVSFIPLLSLPFSIFLTNGSIGQLLYSVFCDISVMFVGVSFTITALNDFIDGNGGENDNWIWGIIILLMIGSLMYGVMAVTIKSAEVKPSILFGVNVAYFLTMFFLALSRYIREILEVKE